MALTVDLRRHLAENPLVHLAATAAAFPAAFPWWLKGAIVIQGGSKGPPATVVARMALEKALPLSATIVGPTVGVYALRGSVKKVLGIEDNKVATGSTVVAVCVAASPVVAPVEGRVIFGMPLWKVVERCTQDPRVMPHLILRDICVIGGIMVAGTTDNPVQQAAIGFGAGALSTPSQAYWVQGMKGGSVMWYTIPVAAVLRGVGTAVLFPVYRFIHTKMVDAIHALEK